MQELQGIFKLISAISAPEKRVFTQTHNPTAEKKLSKQSSAKEKLPENYILLYEDICKFLDGGGETEADFQKKYATRKYIKSYSYTKNYLTEQLLKSIRESTDPSSEYAISQELENIKFLRERKLYDLSYKKLKSLKKEAIKCEKNELLLEILRLERTILMEDQETGYELKIKQVHSEIEKCSSLISEKFELLRLRDEAFLLSRKQNFLSSENQKNKVITLLKNPRFNDENIPESFDPQSNFLFAKAICWQLLGEMDQAWNYHDQLAKLWIDHPGHWQGKTAFYRNVLANFLLQCNVVHKYHNFPERLFALEKGPFSNEDEKAEATQNALYIKLQYHINHAKWLDAEEVICKYLDNQKLIEQKITLSRRMSFYMTISWFYFLTGNPAKSADWNEKLLRLRKADDRKELTGYATIFKMILWIDRNELDGIHSYLKNITRAAKRNKKTDLLNDYLLNLFSGLLQHIHLPNNRELFHEYLKNFRAFIDKPELKFDPRAKTTEIWLRSKSTGNPVQKLAEEEARLIQST